MKTIVIELHGFRKDYIREDTTPFLFSLTEKWSLVPSKSTLGPHVYPSTMTGVYPNKHQHLFKFSLRNKKNNFREIIPLNLYNILINIYRLMRGYTFLTTLPHDKRVGKFTIDKRYNNFHKNAFRIISLFDILRKEKKSFFPCSTFSLYSLYYILCLFLNESALKNDEIATNIFINRLNRNKDDFLFHLLLSADIYGHKYGPNSREIRIAVKNVDNCIKKILNRCDEKNYNIIIFANYGMLSVKQTINLEEKLPEWGKGYLYFLDSNYARFWFFDKRIKPKVITILNSIPNGHIITEEEKKEYHIDFDHYKFGEIIFMVDPYYAIYPNFFNKTIPKGLHSYNLENKDEYGFIMSNRPIKNNAEVVDIAPTILDMMNIEYPENQFDGKSLLVR